MISITIFCTVEHPIYRLLSRRSGGKLLHNAGQLTAKLICWVAECIQSM